MKIIKNLDELQQGEIGTISKINAKGELGRRIRDLGISTGVQVSLLGRAPLLDPIAIKVGDCVLSLRKSEALLVMVQIG